MLDLITNVLVSTLAVEWIEIVILEFSRPLLSVSTLAVEWIEIAPHWPAPSFYASPPSRWSGLKLVDGDIHVDFTESPPSRWSGLKFKAIQKINDSTFVSTLAVEWIEIEGEERSVGGALGLHPRGGVD